MHVLIIDDHPLYREGLKAVLSGLDPALMSTAFGSVEEAIRASAGTPYDLILLDLTLPGVSGIEALRAVKAAFDSVVVINSGADLKPEEILKTIDLGAAGYIHKTTDNTLTLQALRVVLANGIYVPGNVLRSQSAASQPTASGGPRLSFSPKQQLVLDRLLQGKSNKAIARELDIAEGTVKAHLWAVYQMLGVTSRTQALCRMHELGMLGAMSTY